MSRISADECEWMDVEWYGVDRQGNVAVFCSGGTGNLPEFVCADAERAEELVRYFEKAPIMTSSMVPIPASDIAEQAARSFAERGLYSFDADDGTGQDVAMCQTYYTKHASPQKPLNYEMLPEHIRELLKHNFLEIQDFSLVETVHIQHAYSDFSLSNP